MSKKSKNKDSLILIEPKKIESISEYLCDLEDILYAAKIQINFQPKLDDFVNKDTYAILTYGFLYIFLKESKKLKMIKRIHLLNCQQIKLINPNDPKKTNIKITYNGDQGFVELSKTKNKKAKLRELYNIISKIISVISNNFTSSFPFPILDPPVTKRPVKISEVLYRRSLYFIYCDMKEGKIQKASLEGSKYFNNKDINNELIIDSTFQPGDFSQYYGRAISSESQISKIIFQNFNDPKIINLIESINSPSNTEQIICFSKYGLSSPTFNLQNVKNSIEALQFYNSHSIFIQKFLKSCINYTCDIKNVDISSLSIESSDLSVLFETMSKTNCFKNLNSFSISNITFVSFPFKSFEEFLGSQEKLESLSISSINVDGSNLLYTICKSEPQIYKLHLNYLDFQTSLKIDTKDDVIMLPFNLVLFDISHSKFTNKSNSLKPILEHLTSPSIPNIIYMVDMSYLKPESNIFVNEYNSLDLTKLKPNICDLNYSGNHLCSEFFDFIATQKKLQILELNKYNVKSQEKMYNTILDLFKKIHLIGIEFGLETTNPDLIEPFLNSLQELSQIEHLYFSCQEGQNRIALKMAELVNSLPNIKEVSFNMPKLSEEAYFNLISSINNNKSILACDFLPFEDSKSDKINQLCKDLQSKNLKKSTTMDERASLLISQKKKNEKLLNNSIDITTTINLKISKPEIQYDDIDENSFPIEIEEEEEDI